MCTHVCPHTHTHTDVSEWGRTEEHYLLPGRWLRLPGQCRLWAVPGSDCHAPFLGQSVAPLTSWEEGGPGLVSVEGGVGMFSGNLPKEACQLPTLSPQWRRRAELLLAGFFVCHSRCLVGEWFEAEYLATRSKLLPLALQGDLGSSPRGLSTPQGAVTSPSPPRQPLLSIQWFPNLGDIFLYVFLN